MGRISLPSFGVTSVSQIAVLDGFDLTEEGSEAAEAMVAPVLQ